LLVGILERTVRILRKVEGSVVFLRFRGQFGIQVDIVGVLVLVRGSSPKSAGMFDGILVEEGLLERLLEGVRLRIRLLANHLALQQVDLPLNLLLFELDESSFAGCFLVLFELLRGDGGCGIVGEGLLVVLLALGQLGVLHFLRVLVQVQVQFAPQFLKRFLPLRTLQVR